MRPTTSIRRASAPLAVLIALLAGLLGCQGTGYVLEDIEEGALDLVGQGPTVADRLDTLARTHDRTSSARWILLPRTDVAQPLRRALREITLIERADYRTLGARGVVIMSLSAYATRSDSALIRARTLRAVARLAAPFETNPHGRPLDKSFPEALERHGAAREAYVADPTEARWAAFVAATEPVAAVRLWPPERPLQESAEAAVKRVDRASRLALEVERASDPQRSDIDGPGPIAVGARSLVAEHVRLLAAYALIHDPESIVRSDAVEALEEIDDPEAAGVLADASRKEVDGNVRRWIARALGRLGAAPGQRRIIVPALIRLAADADDGVRHHAFGSLRSVTGVDHGTDHEAWTTWWEGARADGGAPEPRSGG